MVSKVKRSDSVSQQGDIYNSILLLAKEGKTKSEISEALALSPQQSRRLLAELTDRGMVRVDSGRHVLITTDRGLTFLRNQKASERNKKFQR